MTFVNSDGYFERLIHGGRPSLKHPENNKKRNWWFVKYNSHKIPHIILGRGHHIRLPEEYVGKKIRIRIEVME